MATYLGVFTDSYRRGEINRNRFFEGGFMYGSGDIFLRKAEEIMEMSAGAELNAVWQDSHIVRLARDCIESWKTFHSMYCLPKDSGQGSSSSKAQCSTERLAALGNDFRRKLNVFTELYLSIHENASIFSDDDSIE